MVRAISDAFEPLANSLMNRVIQQLSLIAGAVHLHVRFDADEAMNIIREFCAGRMSIVLVTDHLEFAASICSRVGFLANGNLLQRGPITTPRTSRAFESIRKFLEVIDRAR